LGRSKIPHQTKTTRVKERERDRGKEGRAKRKGLHLGRKLSQANAKRLFAAELKKEEGAGFLSLKGTVYCPRPALGKKVWGDVTNEAGNKGGKKNTG